MAIEDHDVQEGLHEDDLSVLVHIHGGKYVHLASFKMIMGKAWK